MCFGGPDIPEIKPPAPPPKDDLVDQAALAAKRRSLNANRMGRSSLRIDRNPGVSTGGNGGLSIP